MKPEHFVVYNPARGVYCRACPWWNLTTEDHSIEELREAVLEHKAQPVSRDDPRGIYPGWDVLVDPILTSTFDGERVGWYPAPVPKIRRRS